MGEPTVTPSSEDPYLEMGLVIVPHFMAQASLGSRQA